jgi:hypothetical protein
MTNVLHLPPRPDAAIACDMAGARDTPAERLAEYEDLFERALLRRERSSDGVALTLRAEAREQVADLAGREHDCCPFLEHRVDAVADEVIWTVTNPVHGDGRSAVEVILDALYALPEHAGSGIEGYLQRLADDGVEVVQPDAEHFELR